MTAEEAKAVDQSLSGQFVGIGVQVNQGDDDRIQIRSVFPNTPAEEAGLKRGDVIEAVDGKTTEGETLDETISRVRGPEGEDVTLTIGRDGKPDFDVTITRREYDLPLVSWAMVPDTDIALIRLEQFASGAADAIKGSISAAKEAGAKKIILDLRGNPGGYVGEAVGVASQFVGDGIVYQAISPRRHLEGQRGAAGRPRDGHPARGAHRRRHRQLGGDRDGRDPGRRTGPRSWARRRSAPGRCWAGSTSRTGRRSGSGSSAGSPATAGRSGTRASSPT